MNPGCYLKNEGPKSLRPESQSRIELGRYQRRLTVIQFTRLQKVPRQQRVLFRLTRRKIPKPSYGPAAVAFPMSRSPVSRISIRISRRPIIVAIIFVITSSVIAATVFIPCRPSVIMLPLYRRRSRRTTIILFTTDRG